MHCNSLLPPASSHGQEEARTALSAAPMCKKPLLCSGTLAEVLRNSRRGRASSSSKPSSGNKGQALRCKKNHVRWRRGNGDGKAMAQKRRSQRPWIVLLPSGNGTGLWMCDRSFNLSVLLGGYPLFPFETCHRRVVSAEGRLRPSRTHKRCRLSSIPPHLVRRKQKISHILHKVFHTYHDHRLCILLSASSRFLVKRACIEPLSAAYLARSRAASIHCSAA